jgi:integrase
MSRPWRKNPWPRLGVRGRKSYVVGYYDHDHVERTKSFATAGGSGGAREWMSDYSAAERRGNDSLRRFLLDLDAQEANTVEGRLFAEIVQLYFALDADPSLQGGLARSTFAGYSIVANCYLLGKPIKNCRREVVGRAPFAIEIARQPANRFNEPELPRQWQAQMRAAGHSQQRCGEAWKVLSAILSWAASSHEVPEIRTNGCLLASERTHSRRRSARSGGTGQGRAGRKQSSRTPAWALSPQAVEAIRAQMLMRVRQRDRILALRDATIVSLQYGLAARNQEVWGIRWGSANETFADIVEVISWGELDEYGKTKHSTERRCAVPGVLWEDLLEWRAALRAWGHPARDSDFIIPGDLGGTRWGVEDPRTGAIHLSMNQCRKWGPKFFKPAVAKAAERPGLEAIAGATSYSLRRGGISVRLRAEDAQTVARECGTSLQMLDRHYAFAIDDLRRFGPKPFSEAWSAAREESPSSEPPVLRLVA